MKELDLPRLSAAVDSVLSGDDDGEALWGELSEAISTWPDHKELRRLRSRLAGVFFDHATAIADLSALLELDSADRDARLELALLQHRWAFLLVGEEDGEADDGFPAEDQDQDQDQDQDLETDVFQLLADDDDDEDPVEDPRALALQRQALDWLGELVAAHRDDADFCVELFRRWEDTTVHAPWRYLRLALEASAAHPGDRRLTRVLAMAWDDLAGQAPEGFRDGQPLPMGFLADALGALWDAFMVERAIAAYDTLLADGPADAALLQRRAELRKAMSAYPAAAADFEAAADALAREPEADEAEVEELRRQAQLCRGGRAALVGDSFALMEEAMESLRQPMAPATDVDEDMAAWMREWEQTALERFQQLADELDGLREQRATISADPGPSQVDELRSLASNLAGNILAALELNPLEMRPIQPDAFEGDWQAELQDCNQALARLGWKSLGWVEWPAFRSMFGHQVVSAVWLEPSTGTVALASSAQGRIVVDLETELEDGRQLVTSRARGLNFLVGGPQVDTLFIEPALELEEACALHLARLAWSRAGVEPRRPATLEEVAAMQERGRQAKLRYRLAQGLSDFEALGVPCDYPELFAPMLQETVRAQLAALNPR